VAFSGSYASAGDARSAAARFERAGFEGAYARWVSDHVAVEQPLAPQIFDTGRDAHQSIAAAYCAVETGTLRCWTPNDGFTIVLDATGARRDRAAEAANRGREPAAKTLPFGDAWASGGFSCETSSAALTCRNAADHGFSLPRYRGLPTYF
jgi:hypothetical protein